MLGLANIHSLLKFKRNSVSYKTYTTEVLVCGSAAHNTSDKNYLLFSKEAGMLWASARSVREEKSKQRYALQDFSEVRVSLIKGKSGWRVGSAEAFGNAFLRVQERSERGLINFVFVQVRRYVHGEIPLPKIYNDVHEIITNSSMFREHSLLVQQLFLVRLLSELGYVAPTSAWQAVVSASSIAEACATYTDTMAEAIAIAVHEGTQASHL